MSAHTFFVALPFRHTIDGHLIAGEAKECGCAEAAVAEAEQMSSSADGAVAFSRVIDPMLGTCARAHLLATIGHVPELGYLLGTA